MAIRSRTAAKGSEAPDFTLVDQHGDTFHLADARQSGPVVVVFLRGFT
jgi:peroxiredoxin